MIINSEHRNFLQPSVTSHYLAQLKLQIQSINEPYKQILKNKIENPESLLAVTMAACIFCRIVKGISYVFLYNLAYSSLTRRNTILKIVREREGISIPRYCTPKQRSRCTFNSSLLSTCSSVICQLVIPKCHGAKLTDIPDDQLSEILVFAVSWWLLLRS